MSIQFLGKILVSIMPKQEIQNRIIKLRNEIDHHRYLYHVLDKQEISEAALDSLKNELFKLENANPELITPDSPTQRVAGKPLDKFEKAEHSEKMISLFDAFSVEDMRDWEKRNWNYLLKKNKTSPQPPSFKGEGDYFDYYCELKLDGLAIAIRYEKSNFNMAITRGDSQVGEVVTQNVKTIESLPLKLRYPLSEEFEKAGFNKKQIEKIYESLNNGILEIRGEVIMTKSVFRDLNEKYKKAGKSELANTRNGAAGSLRQLNSKLAAERKLDFYAYDLLGDFDLKKQEEKFIILKMLGIKTISHNKRCHDLREVEKFQKEWIKKKEKLDYDVDGVVVKVNDLRLWSELGIVGKGPRYMIAYKFPAEQVTTKVLEVVWQVGRTGTLTPVAHLEPVSVGGAIISHATLHNMDEIKRLDLRIGDTVIIERSGDVIPKIIEVLKNLRAGSEKKIKPPKKCPMCEGGVEKMGTEVALRCMNKDCFAVRLRALSHFASKGALDVEGLGKKVVEQLLRKGLVLDISEFYFLKKGDLLSLDRFAEKSADNLIKAIAEKKELKLDRLIFSLGILHVGEETANILAKLFFASIKNKEDNLIELEELIKYFKNISAESLEEIEDIGPIVAKSIFAWWRNKKNIQILEKMQAIGVKIKLGKKQKKAIFAGKTIVLTGSLEQLTRKEAKDTIRSLGGKPSSSVSKNTDFVLAGAKPGSKVDKANDLGVEVISEEEFLEMIKI